MSLRESIKKASVESAKARDQLRLDTIRGILSAVKYKEIEKMKPLEDLEILQVIQGLCKQRKDSIDQFQKGHRMDLADKEAKELVILESFLPQQMDADQIKVAVQKVIQDTAAQSIKDMGKVMKVLSVELAGKADTRLVSETVKSLLS